MNPLAPLPSEPVDVGRGRQLQVYDSQTSPSEVTLLFIHGSMASFDQFRYQIALLQFARPTRVVAYDAYGCGKSPRPRDWDSYSTENHMDDLRVLFDKYKSARNLLCAHSFGTTLALRLAAERKGDVAGVACLGAALREDGGPGIFKLPLFLLEWIQPLLSRGFLKRAFHADTLARTTDHHKRIVEHAEMRSGSNDMHVAQAFYRQWVWTRQPLIATIAAPTRVCFICGSHDELAPMAQIEEIISWFSDKSIVSVHVVSPAGHQLMEEQPEEVNRLLADFFAQCLAPPSNVVSVL